MENVIVQLICMTAASYFIRTRGYVVSTVARSLVNFRQSGDRHMSTY